MKKSRVIAAMLVMVVAITQPMAGFSSLSKKDENFNATGIAIPNTGIIEDGVFSAFLIGFCSSMYSIAETVLEKQTESAVTVIPIGRLVIDSIELDATIEEIGFVDGRIGTPPLNVGWFNGSAKLNSTSGTIFLDGHSSGIFTNLHKVEIGQTISIINDDGIKNYQIEAKAIKELTDLLYPILNYYESPSCGISLMTCAGSWSAELNTYTQRLVIYAKLV